MDEMTRLALRIDASIAGLVVFVGAELGLVGFGGSGGGATDDKDDDDDLRAAATDADSLASIAASRAFLRSSSTNSRHSFTIFSSSS